MMKYNSDSQVRESVGLYVADGKIHGVCLRRGDDGLLIERAAHIEFYDELSGTSSVMALQDVMDRLGVAAGVPVYISAAFHDFCTTHLNIADLPLAQMDKMVEIAYRRDVDVGHDPIIFDYEIVGKNVGLGTSGLSVHAFSVEASYKESICQWISSADAEVASICPKLFALRNLVDVTPGAIVVLVLDHKELRIAVVHEGVCFMNHQHGAWKFRSLDFVNRQYVGQLDILQIRGSFL
jgi:uncharacterized protein YceK